MDDVDHSPRPPRSREAPPFPVRGEGRDVGLSHAPFYLGVHMITASGP